jgi:hypothetical protein
MRRRSWSRARRAADTVTTAAGHIEQVYVTVNTLGVKELNLSRRRPTRSPSHSGCRRAGPACEPRAPSHRALGRACRSLTVRRTPT